MTAERVRTPAYDHGCTRLLALLSDELELPDFYMLERNEQKVAAAVLEAHPGQLTLTNWDQMHTASREPWLERTICHFERRQPAVEDCPVVLSLEASQPPASVSPPQTPTAPPTPVTTAYGEDVSAQVPNRSAVTVEAKKRSSPTDTELVTVWRHEPDRYSVGDEASVEVTSHAVQDMLTAFLNFRKGRLGTRQLREKHGISNPTDTVEDIRRLFGHNAIQTPDGKKGVGYRMIVRKVTAGL